MVNGRHDDRLEHADKLIRGAWTGTDYEEQRAVFAALSRDRQEAVVRRLAALLETGATGAAGAACAEMTRSGFLKLRRRFDERREVMSLVPQAKRGSGRREVPIEAVEARIRGELPRATSVSDLAGRVGLEVGLSVPTVRKLARRSRRRAASRSTALASEFGRRFALDLTALDLPIASGRSYEWAMGGFLIERASGLILGWAVDGLGASDSVFAEAFSSGLARAEELGMRIVPGSSGTPELDVVLGDAGHATNLLMQIRAVTAVLPEGRIHASAPRRFARFLLESVGEGVGTLRFRPRTRARRPGVPPAALARRSAVPLESARALVRREVAAHNGPIERTLRRLGLFGVGGDPGALRRALPI